MTSSVCEMLPWTTITRILLQSAPDHKARDVDSDIVKALTRLNVRILDREHSHVRQAYMESLLEPYEVRFYTLGQ